MVEIDRTMVIGVYDTIDDAYISLGDGWNDVGEVKEHVREETNIQEYSIVRELTLVQSD